MAAATGGKKSKQHRIWLKFNKVLRFASFLSGPNFKDQLLKLQKNTNKKKLKKHQ